MKLYVIFIYLVLILRANITIAQIKTGAEATNEYLPLLKAKKVALVVNQTSIIGKKHLIDSLLSLKVNITKIFVPEHGLWGNVEAGGNVNNSTYMKTGIPVISLYGKKEKPSAEDLKDVDLMIFDIQDVGARFYTYISTLTYIMESCAENNMQLFVFDRPNPNGFYIDGPVLEKAFSSFVGLHPVPVVYGMTIGEYAMMVNGEGWLKSGSKCNLKVIKLTNYDHSKKYILPVPPSPNLKSQEAIYLYPSLCFFEGTDVSVGRGTDYPFELIGKPGFKHGNINFTPKSIPGISDHPLYENVECHGLNVVDFCENYILNSKKIYLFWLTGFYEQDEHKDKFFNNFFDKLAGTDKLRLQIIKGETIENIQKSWQPDIDKFKKTRSKYLLYPDFE
jgi:uncharacterized protein YbbC (DUF1343 family)